MFCFLLNPVRCLQLWPSGWWNSIIVNCRRHVPAALCLTMAGWLLVYLGSKTSPTYYEHQYLLVYSSLHSNLAVSNGAKWWYSRTRLTRWIGFSVVFFFTERRCFTILREGIKTVLKSQFTQAFGFKVVPWEKKCARVVRLRAGVVVIPNPKQSALYYQCHNSVIKNHIRWPTWNCFPDLHTSHPARYALLQDS